MANNIVLFGKISQKKVDQLFGSVITEKFPPQLRKLIADGQVCVRVKVDFVELHRGKTGNEELGMLISNTLCFCDEITIIPNERLEQPESQGLELEELIGEQR